MAQESEEKKLPASEKKLRDARRKGQVSTSRDLVSGFSIFAALGFLYFAWPAMWGHLDELVQTVTAPQTGAFTETSAAAIRQTAVTLFLMTGPLVAIVIAVILLFGMIATRGPVFSFEPLKPKFEHVNPAKGLQRIASMRNVVEFVKGLAKAVLLAAVFVAILVAWLQSLFEVPGCGQSCVLPMTLAILTPMGIAAALAFMVVGLIDVPIQRWLFLRDMRMTRTEYKREHKDLEGDPLIRQALQRQRRAAVTQPAKLGLNNAVLVLVGGERLIALRYKSGETPVPIVVSKGQGQVGTALLSRARNLDLPIVQDGALVDDLFPNSRLGEYVEAEHFSAIIRYLVQLGLV